MIKRLYDIARANVHHVFHKWSGQKNFSFEEPNTNEWTEWGTDYHEEYPEDVPVDPLAEYYANLEIPPGSDLQTVRKAWKRLMKKYHPDLHSTDPDKQKTANELSARLTEAYRILEKELSPKG